MSAQSPVSVRDVRPSSDRWPCRAMSNRCPAAHPTTPSALVSDLAQMRAGQQRQDGVQTGGHPPPGAAQILQLRGDGVFGGEPHRGVDIVVDEVGDGRHRRAGTQRAPARPGSGPAAARDGPGTRRRPPARSGSCGPCAGSTYAGRGRPAPAANPGSRAGCRRGARSPWCRGPGWCRRSAPSRAAGPAHRRAGGSRPSRRCARAWPARRSPGRPRTRSRRPAAGRRRCRTSGRRPAPERPVAAASAGAPSV